MEMRALVPVKSRNCAKVVREGTECGIFVTRKEADLVAWMFGRGSG